VGFINLLRRYDKPWMNWRVWSVNLQLERVLVRDDMSHINVIDTGTIVREEYATHERIVLLDFIHRLVSQKN
jgi:hypothetical protein